jgi:ATP-binding cassette, subfamily B, bacterial
MKSILRVFSYLRHYPGMALAQLFCAMGMTLAVFVFPNATGHVIDEIIPNPERHGEFFLGGSRAGRIPGQGRAEFAADFHQQHFEQKVIFDIRSDLYARIQRLAAALVRHPADGGHHDAGGGGCDQHGAGADRRNGAGIGGGAAGAGIGVFLFFLNPTVAAWATLPVPFLAVGAWIYSTKGRDRYRNQRDATSDLNALLHDNISGVRQIKATRRRRRSMRVSMLFRQIAADDAADDEVVGDLFAGMSFLRMTGYVLVLAFGGAAVMEGDR